MKQLNIENPALQFISSTQAEKQAAPDPAAPLAPAMKNNREVRLNLLLPLRNKLKLQKLVERQGYKSVNDYINYLIAAAVEHEAEPTPEEYITYKQQAEARKKK